MTSQMSHMKSMYKLINVMHEIQKSQLLGIHGNMDSGNRKIHMKITNLSRNLMNDAF